MFSTHWLLICLACTPLSIPSLYLAFRLCKKRFLDSIFNQHIALMMIFCGVILPFNLGTAILRLLIEYNPESLTEYESSIPLLCLSLCHSYATWISPTYYMSICAVLFRFVLVKYSHRGLANDRYFWNMNLTLFKTLFWLSNIFLFAINQGIVWAHVIINGRSHYAYSYRELICEKREELHDLVNGQQTFTNPDSQRNGSFLLKTLFLTFAVISAIGINWKKKRQFIQIRSHYNVVTLNETLLLIYLISMDNILFTGLVFYRQYSDDQTLAFTLELLRIILIENILFKFLVPLYLILQSRTHYKILWAESMERKLNFFMTQPSFIPRPVVSKYQTSIQLTPSVQMIPTSSQTDNGSSVIEEIPRSSEGECSHRVTVTIHAAPAHAELPSIEIN